MPETPVNFGEALVQDVYAAIAQVAEAPYAAETVIIQATLESVMAELPPAAPDLADPEAILALFTPLLVVKLAGFLEAVGAPGESERIASLPPEQLNLLVQQLYYLHRLTLRENSYEFLHLPAHSSPADDNYLDLIGRAVSQLVRASLRLREPIPA